jgi:hypothetical protein
MSKVKVVRDEDRLKVRYLKILKIIVLLAIIYFFWTVFHIISVYLLGFGSKWAAFTMDQWILSSIIFFSICIGLVLLFVLHHYIIKKRRIESEKPKPIFYKGKRLYTYTQPDRSKGGIFSKTFVKIDDGTALVLRFQMIPPINLWGKNR